MSPLSSRLENQKESTLVPPRAHKTATPSSRRGKAFLPLSLRPSLPSPLPLSPPIPPSRGALAGRGHDWCAVLASSHSCMEALTDMTDATFPPSLPFNPPSTLPTHPQQAHREPAAALRHLVMACTTHFLSPLLYRSVLLLFFLSPSIRSS
jgi:hypothetical protein